MGPFVWTWASGFEFGLGSGFRTDSKWLNQNTGIQLFGSSSIQYKSFYITGSLHWYAGDIPREKIDSSFSNHYSIWGYGVIAGYGFPISSRIALVPGLGFSYTRFALLDSYTPTGGEKQSFYLGSFISPMLQCSADYLIHPQSKKPKYLVDYGFCLRVKYEASLVEFKYLSHFQHFLSISVICRLPLNPKNAAKKESNQVPKNVEPLTPVVSP